MRPILPGLLFFAFSSVFYPSTGSPGTIFSNINNSPSSVCCGYAVGTYPGTTNVFIDAFPFTPLGNGFRLDSVGLLESEFRDLPVPAGLTLFLFSDSSCTAPGFLDTRRGYQSMTRTTIVDPDGIVRSRFLRAHRHAAIAAARAAVGV